MVTDLNAYHIDTPALLIDLDGVEKNLANMQKKADAAGAMLRPHIKTHKIPELAQAQIQMGAVGVTTAKISEAEVMADGGIDDIFIFLDGMQIALGVAASQDCALTVIATVISRPAPNRAVIDAGSKVFALDKGAHGQEMLKGFGMVLNRKAVLDRLSEEHGVMLLAPNETLEIGERVKIIPNHACTVINLFDRAYGIRGGKVETELIIAGRGKVQ
jgi:D-serine deaminase-like pyridoxal phosphate-dependent protein